MKVITLDKEIFEKAFELCHKTHTDSDIARILDGNDDVEKQIAILQIENISNISQARQLIFHLTNHDGPIREASAIKLRELFIEKNNSVINTEEFYPVFADAVCDVNPNICRLVIEFLPLLNQKEKMTEILVDKIENIFERIDNPDKEQKNFLTVRMFNLYWCLEAIGELLPVCREINFINKLSLQLKRSILFGDYTIDEKAAKIVTCEIENEYFKEIAETLKKSQNFYVKRYFLDGKI